MSDPALFFLTRRGRPPRAGTRSTHRIEFLVTDDERKAIEYMAAAEGKGIATVIRDAINEFVADYGERRIFPRR